jgi:hypothetical protein
MATNEVFKYGQWISLPLPLRGDDPTKNDDPTRNGDPVLIGDLVGVAQEVGGVPVSYAIGSLTVTQARNTADSLEPGWASVALCGAWAIPVQDFDPAVHGAGTTVNINAAAGSTAATLTVAAGDHRFGTIIGWTKMMQKDNLGNPVRPIPIVNIVQNLTGVVNAVPDMPIGS